jgi:radical SAM superfamily enzyme YgiQ (UPF0313 family)
MANPTGSRRFLLYLIKSSHYDDDGYVIQWLRSALPSNSLACLHGLVVDCAQRHVLGEDVEIESIPIDETNTRVRPRLIAERIKRNGGFGMVALVGVQSNQFPRSLDIARPLRAAGVQVCIGGFHVSGCLAMLPEMQTDLQQALDLGISLFAGEGEGRLEMVLQDAAKGALQPIYNFVNDLPNLQGAALPFLPADRVQRTVGYIGSFDAGRGCPFQCSFCTIINVQGRKSRFRSADDIEAIVRANLAQKIRHFLITDDNMARNKNWEAIFDRLIHIRETEGLKFKLVIQVDTLCHKIPNFIEKAARAGVRRVFIGLENINPENLIAAKKKQNRISDYREMLLAWRKVRCLTYCGYIIGLPSDTIESVVRDIKIIQKELPLDILEFSCLTPLPGSEDHKRLWTEGVDMDADMNRYDLEHVTTDHPKMSREEWEHAYHIAWKTYYTPDHIKTVIRRAVASRMRSDMVMYLLTWFWLSKELWNIYPLESGIIRRKARTDRRPGLPIESIWTFYPKYIAEHCRKHFKIARAFCEMFLFERAVRRDPQAPYYMDMALNPSTSEDYNEMEMFQVTEAARNVATKGKKHDAMHSA